MRVFKHFNNSGNENCSICNSKKDGETVLIGIDGTERGGNIEAAQVHLDCLDLRLKINETGGSNIIYQIANFPYKRD